MATVTLNLGETIFLASYASTYNDARNGQNVTIAEYPWIGQYLGEQYEVNQVGLSFDQSGLSGPALEAKLILTVTESHGATIEVREHDWAEGSTGSFVSNPSTVRLLGSLAVASGVTGEITIPLNVIGRRSPFKVILTIADQTNNVAPTGDDTILFADAWLEVVIDTGHGIAGDGSVSISAPKTDAQGSQITVAYSAIRFAPTADGSSAHGVAASLAIPLAQPTVTASGSLQPKGVGAIMLGSSKVEAVASQAGYAPIRLWSPVAAGQALEGVSVNGVINLTGPFATDVINAGVTGQGDAPLSAPGVTAIGQRGTASSAAVPLAMRVTGGLTHSIAAGGVVFLTTSVDAQGGRGVAAGATVTLTGPMSLRRLSPGHCWRRCGDPDRAILGRVRRSWRDWDFDHPSDRTLGRR